MRASKAIPKNPSNSARLPLFAGLLILLALATAARAQEFPALTGRVVDQAGYLDAGQEAALADRLEALEQRTGRQMVVVTLPNLRGGGDISYPEDDFANRLFREWELGDAERDDGVLLLVAAEERRVRIEVGYGLEPVLTDALAATIVRNDILPRFREGDMAGGVIAGSEAVLLQLELPEEEAAQRQHDLLAEKVAPEEPNDFLATALVVLWVVIFLWIAFGAARRRGGGSVSWGPGWSSGSSSWGGGGGGGFSGGFSGGGGSSGGGGASGGW
ncbi:MAG: TPM domain-containing protein [Sphingomonadaceae bacterium]|nr:TPM domain-containing protein [Sphingomonadaceae bacterium]